MILYWLDKLGGWILWLFKKPTDLEVARIDRNLKCPACGACRGELRCVVVAGMDNQPRVQVQHRCRECGGRFYAEPVGKVDLRFMSSAIPRTDVEKEEDRQAIAYSMPPGALKN